MSLHSCDGTFEGDRRCFVCGPGVEQSDKIAALQAEVDQLKARILFMEAERHAEAIANTKSLYGGSYFIKENARLREALGEALDRAEEHYTGCLYCGEGKIVDGSATAEHQNECWYYKAKRLLESSPVQTVAGEES